MADYRQVQTITIYILDTKWQLTALSSHIVKVKRLSSIIHLCLGTIVKQTDGMNGEMEGQRIKYDIKSNVFALTWWVKGLHQ